MSDLVKRLRSIRGNFIIPIESPPLFQWAEEAADLIESQAVKIERLQARVDELEGLRSFIEEIWFAHRDKDSEEYNECELAECCWCEKTRKALEGEQ